MSATNDLPTRPTKPGNESRRWELLLLFSSLIAVSLYAAAAYHETTLAPWRGYQHEYRSMLIADATNLRSRQAAESFKIRYYQSYLPELGRVDRCTTCHLGVENPAMKDAKEPLKTHPGDLLLHHPADRFGCTICHGGRGRATEAREAHGEDPHRPEPMRRGAMLQVACAQCHSDPELPGMSVYNLSRKLVTEKGCLACHALRGTGATLRSVSIIQGPDLTEQAGKHDFQWQVEHFLDPEKKSPGSKMPNFGFRQEEAEALAYLMMSFTGESPAHGYIPPPTAGSETGTQPPLLPEQLGANIDPDAAEGYVGSDVCRSCHSALNPGLGHTWQNSKMANAYEAISDVADNEICLPCHTTGHNPDTNAFVEPNVGCEACHGPGKDYVTDVLAGNLKQHKDQANANVLEPDRCLSCHQSMHVPTEKHEEIIRAAHAAPAEHAESSEEAAEEAAEEEEEEEKEALTEEEVLEYLEELGAKMDSQGAPGYVGSEPCLFCHTSLDPEVIEHWQNSKKANTFEAVSEVADHEVCLPCHTTGYNPDTNAFTEPNVGCEACHGPGRVCCIDAVNERRAEHAELANPNSQDKNLCVGCHRVHVPRERHQEIMRDQEVIRLSTRRQTHPRVFDLAEGDFR